jgi:hypothetical protein
VPVAQGGTDAGRSGPPVGPVIAVRRFHGGARQSSRRDFVDNHDGTATISGTLPGARRVRIPLTIRADNGVSPEADQSFTLKVVPALPIP